MKVVVVERHERVLKKKRGLVGAPTTHLVVEQRHEHDVEVLVQVPDLVHVLFGFFKSIVRSIVGSLIGSSSGSLIHLIQSNTRFGGRL